jgi:alpha-methylacyl-CoA racemase
VVRVDRVQPAPSPLPDARPLMARGRRSMAVDLKQPSGRAVVLSLVDGADVLIEGFRPGVAERLGVGPEECLARNPRLVYGRVTGWGQTGPLAGEAGHDINYIGLTGVLDATGRDGAPPTPPLNLVGDFGGGGLLLVVGVLAALLECRSSGRGQVVDAAMVDGAGLLATMFHELIARGGWSAERGTNVLDSGAPYYDVYPTADGRWMAVGALEPQFFAELLRVLDIDIDPALQHDRNAWPSLRASIASALRQRTQSEWTDVFSGRDACVTPVLSFAEAATHPHAVARNAFVRVDGAPQPAPAPRFDRTPCAVDGDLSAGSASAASILAERGVTPELIAEATRCGALRDAPAPSGSAAP